MTTTNTYTCYIAACYGNSIMGSGAAGINTSDACPTVAAAVKQVADQIKTNHPYILKNLPVTVTTIQTTVSDGIPTVSAFTTTYTGQDIAWLTTDATPMISDVVPAKTEIATPPEPITTHYVVCASDSFIMEGPDPDYRKLLDKVAENNDYQGFSDQPIVISIEGTPEAIAALAKLKIGGWVDDPDNYDEDDDGDGDDDSDDDDDDDDDDEDEDEDEEGDEDDDEPSFTQLTE
ncbi:MAG: hypothetical protein U0X20_17160 [Caldilineaceae bacterium]